MARAMTVTKTRQHDAISFPVLTYTDAEPRNDLREINSGHGQHHFGKGEDVTQWQFPRPTAGDDRSRKPPPGGIATFDFQLTAPPEEMTPGSARSARSPIGMHTIGVALGSPGMVSSEEVLPPPRFNTAMFTQGQSSPRKASKWKKIGGMFKAKSALTSAVNNEKEHLIKDKTSQRKEEMTEEWPKIETDSKQSGTNASPQRSRKFSFSGRKSSKDKNTSGRTSPMLDVNIPDVHMERYSVMFGNVMTKNQKPSLLARRSKTLDNLHVPSAKEFLSAKVPAVPQRRATSPARSSFTLFPSSQPTKAAQFLGTQNFSRGPSPLLRSNTLPVESPSKASPLEHPKFPNNNSQSSFNSPAISNVFSERSNTPQSSSPYTNKEDKPLPAIKPEPVRPRERVASPQVPPKLMKPQLKGKPEWPVEQKQRSVSQREGRSIKAPAPAPVRAASAHAAPAHTNRPNLKLKTELQAPPPPAKDYNTPKSAPTTLQSKSPASASTTRIKSPEVVSVPLSMGSSPSKKASTVVTEREIKSPDSYVKKVPAIEVSTARSISVSRAKRQMLVPIAARVDQLSPNERYVERRAMTPTITDVQYGHRHAVSQELQIESV